MKGKVLVLIAGLLLVFGMILVSCNPDDGYTDMKVDSTYVLHQNSQGYCAINPVGSQNEGEFVMAYDPDGKRIPTPCTDGRHTSKHDEADKVCKPFSWSDNLGLPW